MSDMNQTYETHAKGIRILPGQWRPHYRFEQIAWISPSWPCQDYVWLDSPEAIFCESGLLFLSHVNPAHPVMFPDLPKVDWQVGPGGLSYERLLPNGVGFGGSVTAGDGTSVRLDLHIHNGSGEVLKDVKLQTCAYLRGIKEFSGCTRQNTFVHVPDIGWRSWDEAHDSNVRTGRFRLGWRGGPPAADLPVIVTTSSKAQRLFAMTWHDDTYSLMCNPGHPCVHADPTFGDIAPGQRAEIHGKLIFFEGTLDQFADWFSPAGTAASPGSGNIKGLD